MRKRHNVILLLILTGFLAGCRHVDVPKPRGHFRIDLPPKSYSTFDGLKTSSDNLPFSFEYPAFGKLSFNEEFENEKGWFNIEFPTYRAKIYLTYKDINHDFDNLMEQTYKMNVKNHISKADAINEKYFTDSLNNVYGILYDLKGNTASSVQFFMTDSTRHFLRGSLYFASVPDADSLQPVIDYFRDDIVHLIETLRWKK
jgi:gliding motility-associated lipoprotein GldD